MSKCKYCNANLNKYEISSGMCWKCENVKLPLVRKLLKKCKQIKAGVNGG